MIKPFNKPLWIMMLALTVSAGPTRSATPTEPMAGSTTNAQSSSHDGSHVYENGFCTLCDKYQPATQNGEGIYEIANAPGSSSGLQRWSTETTPMRNLTARTGLSAQC